jgi:hypothetical protein
MMGLVLSKLNESMSWIPEDFGFFSIPERPDVFYRDNYELRRMPNNMWLLRRRKKSGNRTEILVKAYYYILEEDYIFAQYLFDRRLNGGNHGTELQRE